MKSSRRPLTAAILSLSLLTVMAGAAVAPALGVIKAYFSDANPVLVQMIISVPALFIVLTNAIFPVLCRRFKSRTLALLGLFLYTVGGCVAGVFSSIYLVLIMRALVGIGVGIIMPLSTGLLSFYYPPEKLDGLMGLSSAMNQMGGVVATLLAGLLSAVSWRASFLVYLMGLLSILLCLVFLPNDSISPPADGVEKRNEIFRTYFPYILAMFLLMSSFFLYPANFALETTAEGLIPQRFIALIMAGMDLVAFLGGLLFVRCKLLLGRHMRLLAPILFLAGYLLLFLAGGWFGTLAGSVCVGFANGVGIPFLISQSSLRAGRSAAATVMPLLSAALYLAQFLSPILMGAVSTLFGGVEHLPYCFAAILSAAFLLWSWRLPSEPEYPK